MSQSWSGWLRVVHHDGVRSCEDSASHRQATTMTSSFYTRADVTSTSAASFIVKLSDQIHSTGLHSRANGQSVKPNKEVVTLKHKGCAH